MTQEREDTPTPPIQFDELLKRCNNKVSLARNTIEIFVDEVGQQVSKLDNAIKQNDIPLMQLVAHTIKGTAAMASANQISRSAAEIEAAVKSKDIDSAVRLFDELVLHTDQCIHFASQAN